MNACSHHLASVSRACFFVISTLFAPTPTSADVVSVDYLALAKESSYLIKDFTFASGERLPQLKINFATWGEPKTDRRGNILNAVLLCHGTTGSWQSFGRPGFAGTLFGAGQPLDISKYYVIASDAIGSGKSSKPSDGLRMKFPKYRLDDVVKAQQALLVEKVGVKRLLAVMGISYGGRQVWQWAVQYPDFMQAAIPIVSSPFPNAGRRGMFDFLGVETITADPGWKNGDYSEQPRGLQLAWMMAWTNFDGAGHLWEVAPTREQSFAYLPEMARKTSQTLDANDFIYQLRVNDGFDAFSQIDRIKARVLIINMSGDELVPIELGHAEKALEKLGPRAEYLLVKDAAGFGHIAAGQTTAIWGNKVDELLKSMTPTNK